jgi:hypothetical protein
MQFSVPMEEVFNAQEFVENVKRGELDGRLIDELRKLSDEELEEVVGLIMDERLKNQLGGTCHESTARTGLSR